VLALTGRATAQTAASTVEVEAPDYPPPSARWKVAGVGLGAFAVFYGSAVGLSYVYPDVPGVKDLRIPVVGPWIAVGNNACPSYDPDCSTAWKIMRTILEALDGVAQAGSLAIVLEGAFMPTQEQAPGLETPRAPTAPPPPAKPAPGGGDKLFFVPLPMTVGSRGIGFGVTGRF
jgi:hypothetical protein